MAIQFESFRIGKEESTKALCLRIDINFWVESSFFKTF
jgi:hypothetical protein